jgi:membrane protein YdbS with pleckstrin-like domain
MDNPQQTQMQTAAIEWLPVDARAPRLWTISGILATVWIAIPVSLVASATLPWSGAIGLGLGAVVLAALVVRRYAQRRYRITRYALADDGFLLRTGVWWRSELFVPQQRIQHVDVTEGPLARRFGLATLSLHSAGAHMSTANVSGLAAETAFAVRDRLLHRGAGAVATPATP